MDADNDIVERLREGARDASGRDMADHASTWGSLTCADLREAAAEIVRLRGEVDAMETCAVKYLGWLGVKDAAAALRKDMADPEMLGHAIAPAEAFDPSIHPIPGEGQQPAMPNGVDGLDLIWLNRILLRVSTAASDVETQSKAREQAAAIRRARKSLRAADNRDE